jgi:hypothetical protein
VKKLLFALFAVIALLKFCSCNYGKEAQQSEIIVYKLTAIDTVWRESGERVLLTWESNGYPIKRTFCEYDHHFFIGMFIRNLR